MSDRSTPQRRLNVLFFGTFDAEAHPRVAVLRESFEAMGDNVRTINHPLGFGTADRVDAVGSPWKLAKPALSLVRSWWRLARDSRRLGSWKPDVVVVGYLAHVDVILARALFRCDVVFDMMVGLADTIESRGLKKGPVGTLVYYVARGLDLSAQRLASVTIYDTEAHRQLLSGATDNDVVVPVGATQGWWQVDPQLAGAARSESQVEPNRDELRVIFFGTYSPLQGATVIGSAIDILKDHLGINFTMVGVGQERPEVEKLAAASANVRWIDWLSTDELIEAVASHHVCLGIFGTTARSGRVIPNKVYQGIAAGCVVITGDYEGQSSALGNAANFVAPGSPEALADAIVNVANNPEPQEASSLEWASPENLGRPLRQRLLK